MAGTDKAPSQFGQIVKLLTDISGYVAGIVAYFVAITGRMGTPYRETVAVLTLLTTVIVLWAWRWPQISQKRAAGKARTSSKAKKLEPQSPLDQILDSIRFSSRDVYALPLARRRLETMLMSVLALVAVGRTVSVFPNILQELNPPPYDLAAPCNQDGDQNVLRAVIADFYETSASELLFEERLEDEMQKQLQGEDVQICHLNSVIRNREEAKETSEGIQAVVLIWGRSDMQGVDVNMEVMGWDDLSNVWTFQAGQNDFQLNESSHFTFLTQYIFSLLRYINGQYPEARQDLESAIGVAEDESWIENADNRTDLAQAYFLLGLIYERDETLSEAERLQKARASYDSAIEYDANLNRAVLNRGQICLDLGDLDCAVADATSLIDRQSEVTEALVDSAYINRAYARQELGDLSGAISDFESAIQRTPDDPEIYHDLGQAQLLLGDYAGAIKTYNAVLPYLSDGETRDEFVEDLNDLTPPPGSEAEFQQAVEQIVQVLEAAKLP